MNGLLNCKQIPLKTSIFICYFILCSTTIFGQSIYINEFMASNSSTILDEFGGSDDWVELYNSDNSPIDIGGMYLTDDLEDPTKWQIPTTSPSLTTIPAEGFILLWFDKEPDQGILHVDTKLSSSGESIGLFAADGLTVIDSLSYGSQLVDISVGRVSDGGPLFSAFSTATPNATNETGTNNTIVVMPSANFEGGHYTNSLQVTLSTTTPGATIRYTIDGSEPTESSPVYSSPLAISVTTPLRARAFKTDFTPSRTMTHTYLYNASHSFPVICLTTNDEYIFDTIIGIYGNWMSDSLEQPVHIEFFETDGSLAFQQDVGFSIHGGGSARNDLKGLNIIARSEYGDKTMDYKVFPELPYDRYESFILRASGNDSGNTMFRDAMASSLIRDMEDVDACIKDPNIEMQAYRPGVVYMNGNYFGIQNIRERYDGRYIERTRGIDKDEVDVIVSRKTVLRGDEDAWEDFFDFHEENSMTIDANYDSLQTMINLDHFIDYYVFNMYVDNTDWPGNNNRRYREKKPGKKWRFMVYDLDFGFGLGPLTELGWNSGDWRTNQLEHITADSSALSANRPDNTLLIRRLFERQDFRTKFVNRMADQLNILYTPERIVSRIDSFQMLYETEMILHQTVNDTRPWDFFVDRLRIFAENRDTAVWGQFDRFFNEITDVVDIDLSTSPTDAGKIELNTMRFKGDKLPWTGRYFAGVDVPISTIAARGYIFDDWSLSSLGNDANTILNLDGNESIVANFNLGSTQVADIVINEINYNSPGSANSGDWVELYNNSNTSVDLSAWYLEDESNEYFNIPEGTIIPAGGYLVLVEDSVQFQTVYPAVTNFVGGFGQSIFGSFKFQNDSEKISISNADQSYIDIVEYADRAPWPEEPDGNGPALQLIHPDLDNTVAANWIQDTPTPGGPLDLGNTVSYFSCPSNQTVQTAPGATTAQVTWNDPIPISSCGLSPVDQSQINGLTSGSNFPIGNTTVNYQATDICNGVNTCSFIISVQQVNAVLNVNNCPSNITVSSLVGSNGAIASWTAPTSNSNCSLGAATINQTVGLMSGSLFPVGNNTVTYQAQDACSNSEACSFIVIVEQAALVSTLNCSSNIIRNASIGALGMIVNWDEPIGNTTCEIGSSNITQTSGPANGSFLPTGVTTIGYTYSTGCGDDKTCSFTITVEEQDAVMNVTCPTQDITVASLVGSIGAVANWTEPSANSNCSLGPATISQSNGLTNGSVFPVGTSNIIYNASDGCNNINTCSFNVVVTQEALVSSFDCPTNIEVVAPIGATDLIVNWTEPIGVSNCEVNTPSTTQTAGLANGSLFPLGVSTVEYNYSSGCNDNLTCNFTVTVNGQAAVMNVTCPTQDVIVTALVGATGEIANWTEPSATSDCSLSPATINQISGLPNGSEFPVGITEIVYSATDGCSNTEECSFNIFVTQQDFMVEFTCPEDIMVIAPNGSNGIAVTWPDPTIMSNCEVGTPELIQTQGPLNGSVLPFGVTEIKYQYFTGCGIDPTCSFTITIDESTSINDLEKELSNQIQLYPNPTNSNIYLDVQNIDYDVLAMDVYNSLGQKVIQGKLSNSNLHEINVAEFSNGVYIMLLRLEDGLSVRKQFVVSQ